MYCEKFVPYKEKLKQGQAKLCMIALQLVRGDKKLLHGNKQKRKKRKHLQNKNYYMLERRLMDEILPSFF